MILGVILATAALLGALWFWFGSTEEEKEPVEEKIQPIQRKKKKKKKKERDGPDFSRLKKKKIIKKKGPPRVKGNMEKDPLHFMSLSTPFSFHNFAFSNNGRQIAGCLDDGHVRVWQFGNNPKEDLKHKSFWVEDGFISTAVAFGAGEKYIAIAVEKDKRPIHLYKNPWLKEKPKKNEKKEWTPAGVEADLPMEKFFTNHKSPISTILIAPNTAYLLTCCNGTDCTIKLWQPRDGTLIHSIGVAQMVNYNAAISLCGRFITASTMMSNVSMWEVFGLQDGEVDRVKMIGSVKQHKKSVFCASFSPPGLDGEIFLATASKDATWKLFDIGVRNRQLHHDDPTMIEDKKMQGPVNRIAVSPSKEVPIIAFNVGAQIRFYNYKKRVQLATFIPKAFNGEILQMWFNPKATVLATLGKEKYTVRLWKVPQLTTKKNKKNN